MENQTLDQDAVNLAKAIRQSESGGNFGAKGESGEVGGYQFTHDTWNESAPKYGINVPIDKATPEQQNAVAYNRIKAWKDAGYDVTQIASMWNAGAGEPNAYKGKFEQTTKTHNAGDPSSGTNSFGAHYDVPKYVESVGKAYLAIKGGGQPSIDPNNPSSVQPAQAPTQTPAPQPQGLGQELMGRTNDAGNAIQDTLKGKINPVSGVLQTVGAVAGGIGDIVNKGLELVPGVKQLEGLLGKGIGALAKTTAGQHVTKAIQDFSTAHPELSADIGAGFNIVTAIPILKGLGVVKNLAMDSVSIALKDVAEKGAFSDLVKLAPNVEKATIKDAIAQRLIPDISSDVNGVTLSSTSAMEKTANLIQQGKNVPALTKIYDLLDTVDGKTIPHSLTHKAVVEGASSGVGATVGGMLGNPLAGGLVGHYAKGAVEKGVGKLTRKSIGQGVLKRTAQDATRQTIKGASKKVGGMVGGTALQKVTK